MLDTAGSPVIGDRRNTFSGVHDGKMQKAESQTRQQGGGDESIEEVHSCKI